MGYSQNFLHVSATHKIECPRSRLYVSALLEGLYLLNLNLWIFWFWKLFLNPIFLTEKSPRSYVGLYQKFLYKISLLLLTPPPLKILLTPPPMRQRLILVQVAQCYVILKKLLPSAVISAHSPNMLMT